MPKLKTPLPNKRVITRDYLQDFWSSEYKETTDRIYRLTKQKVLVSIRKGIFLNTRLGIIRDKGLVNIACTLFPGGYVTGYRALRYWGTTNEDYYGLCLRDDPTTDIIVPKVISQGCNFNGFCFVPHQMKKELRFGYKETKDGNIAEPEKAILDIMYLTNGVDSGQIEWDLLNENVFINYSQKFPPKVRKQICP